MSVAVIGLGGLGCPAATALARAGVSLGLFDPDRVEPSNLPRQLLYREEDVGRLKAEVAAERLRPSTSGLRPYARGERNGSARDERAETDRGERNGTARDERAETDRGERNGTARDERAATDRGERNGTARDERAEADRGERNGTARDERAASPFGPSVASEASAVEGRPLAKIAARPIAIDAATAAELAPYEVWIDGTDSLAKKLMLSDLAVRMRRTLIHAGAVRLRGQLLAIVPGRGPCLRCLLDDDGEAEASCRQAGILGPVVGTLGSLAALFALRALRGEDVAGELVSFDASTGALRQRRVARRPDCPACASRADAEADVTGEVCPMTFVRARLALEKLAPGGRLGVWLRGAEPLANLPRSFAEEGHRVLSLEPREGGRHYLLVEKAGPSPLQGERAG